MVPMGWALASLASSRLPLPQGTMRTAAQMIAGGAAVLAVSLGVGEHPVLVASARSVAAVVYLTIFGSLLAFSAYMLLLRHMRPVVATSYAYVNPVVAIVLGVAFAGERLGLASLAGVAIVLAAVVLVGVARARALGGERTTTTNGPRPRDRMAA
jgi:drug/metabolite transporter (DMT)-like permease